MKLKMLGTFLVPFLFLSCNKQSEPAPVETAAPAVAVTQDPALTVHETNTVVEVDLDKGRRLYLSNCISCHNRDPNMKGAVGPEMVDAPIEVMTSKVMTGKYPDPLPAGFVPKRKTKAMLKIVKLEKDIPSIHAWVQSQKKK